MIGACTTAWDAAHQVIATMGDRFVLVRLATDDGSRRKAGLQAMANVGDESAMREELSAAARSLFAAAAALAAAALTRRSRKRKSGYCSTWPTS